MFQSKNKNIYATYYANNRWFDYTINDYLDDSWY